MTHYQKGLKSLEHIPENHVTGFVRSGIATSYMEQKELPEAKRYLDSAQDIADRSKNLQQNP